MRITTLLLAAAAPILISALPLEATAQDFFSNPFEEKKPVKKKKTVPSGRRSARTRRGPPGRLPAADRRANAAGSDQGLD